MFRNLLSSHRPQFEALATAWLNAGATTVSVWNNNELVEHWPADSALQAPDLVAPIVLGNYALGEIQVTGFQGHDRQNQLTIETELMSQLTQLSTELELARQVQHSLLPQKLPQLNGMELFAESRSALQVGGDYYDFVQQSPDKLTFTVGDVSSKGMSAAMLMAVLLKVVRTSLKVSQTATPKSMFDYAKSDMYEEFANIGMFATSFIGQYDSGTHTLTYANAGHSPVIYRPANSSAILLEADDVPIGILATNSCSDHKIQIQPHDLLIVATDGLVEARNPGGEMFGYERLLDLVTELKTTQSAESISRTIFTAVESFVSGLPREDDQTLLIFKRKDVNAQMGVQRQC